MIRKFLRAGWKAYCSYRIEQLRGEVEGLAAIAENFQKEYPENPFWKGVAEGNREVTEAYHKAFKTVEKQMPLNSYTAICNIFWEAQREQTKMPEFDVDQFVKNLHIDLARVH